MDPVQLSEEQMSTLADMLATKMMANQPKPDAQEEEVKPTKKTETENKAPTLEEITKAVTASLQENTTEQNQKMLNLMWDDKLKSAISSTQGLGEFLEGEDDYGYKRSDKLNEVQDLDKRLSALDKLTNSFKEASAGQAGRRPIVNKVAQQKEKESNESFDELKRKQAAGEFNSVPDMAKQWMEAVAKEADGLM